MVYNLDVRKLRKVFIALVAVAVLWLTLVTVGSDEAAERIYNKGYSDTVDYSVGILENGYEIEILNVDGYRLYQPKTNTEWVFVFIWVRQCRRIITTQYFLKLRRTE